MDDTVFKVQKCFKVFSRQLKIPQELLGRRGLKGRQFKHASRITMKDPIYKPIAKIADSVENNDAGIVFPGVGRVKPFWRHDSSITFSWVVSAVQYTVEVA